jgi:hypothetical protein
MEAVKTNKLLLQILDRHNLTSRALVER